MYNMESYFKTFYNEYVVLPKEDKQKLFRIKDANISRLKEGLKKYNQDNDTNHKLVEVITQGSVAMSTVVQNESNDYDIDVAIVFDKDSLPEGTIETKNLVVNMLKDKCKQFNTEPEAKTNCVRISYEEGYHIDFAIYRRTIDSIGDYQYEHCGSEWRKRDPKSITRWFIESNRDKEYNLRIVVRLLKMFCRSRDSWSMPGGLVQSVLLEECFEKDNRIDEMFYETIKAVRNRLAYNKEVYNPADMSQSLKLIKKDDDRLQNLQNRLTQYIDKFNVLFERDCNHEQALQVWNDFFNHKYWQLKIEEVKESIDIHENIILHDESEEFISYLFPVDKKYDIILDCDVEQDGFRVDNLKNILKQKKWISPQKTLKFSISSNNVPKPYDVYWKVKNRGLEAKRRNHVRGQIIKTNSETHTETTKFKGEHFVECFIVQNGICVAKAKIDVPISYQYY